MKLRWYKRVWKKLHFVDPLCPKLHTKVYVQLKLIFGIYKSIDSK